MLGLSAPCLDFSKRARRAEYVRSLKLLKVFKKLSLLMKKCRSQADGTVFDDSWPGPCGEKGGGPSSSTVCCLSRTVKASREREAGDAKRAS